MSRIFSALAAGLIFGFGLCVAQMTNPARIIGFLDVAGAWDPTLVMVMIGALAVAGLGFTWTRRRQHPLFADKFYLPTARDIDLPLLVGSALFGLGWGIGGLCPGPAITALASLSPQIALFVAAMIAGQLLVIAFERSATAHGSGAEPAASGPSPT